MAVHGHVPCRRHRSVPLRPSAACAPPRLRGMIARYRAVLATPGSLRLYVTGVFARLPQGMSGFATLLLVREATHSYALAGFAVGIQAVAIALVGPLQGRLVDRHGRGRVLLPWAVGPTALVVALVAVGPAP